MVQKALPRLEVKQLLHFRRPLASRSSVITPRLVREIVKRGKMGSDHYSSGGALNVV